MPVAQGSIPCLVMEKLLVDFINLHLLKRSLIDRNQHDFVRSRSTATNLLITHQQWGLFLARGRDVHCIFFNFSKAFDRVNHCLLLRKLSSMGFSTGIVVLCAAYFRNRSFSCKVNRSMSASRARPSGVPQGSCICPLLWTIFINDIGDCLPDKIQYQIFADDVKVYCEIKNAHDCAMLQLAADRIAHWADANGMLL